MAQTHGLVIALSNADIEQAQSEGQEIEERVESALSSHVRRAWQRAHSAKSEHEQRLMQCLRQRNGEYDPDKLAEIRRQGGSELYMMLTAVKCRAAKSWIRDVLMPAGDRPWDIDPSYEPDLPPHVEQQVQQEVLGEAVEFMQATGQQPTPQMFAEILDKAREEYRDDLREQAKKRAERMAETIEEMLDQGGWRKEFDANLSDLVDFGTAIQKGPVVRRADQLHWGIGGTPEVQTEYRPEVERVSPFDFYPAPGATDIDEGYMIQRHRLRRAELYDLIGLPGYDEQAIREVLREHDSGYLREWLTSGLDSARNQATQDETSTFAEDLIDAIEYWGEVPGRHLIEWGMDEAEVGDPDREVPVTVWLIGSHVIRAVINPDPLGRKPYSKASFEPVPGSFWGRGVPDLIRDCQDVCNAAARALVNNMGIASGPQVAVDPGSLPAGEEITAMYPWKIWQLEWKQGGGQGGARAPIEFFQPNPMVRELQAVYEHYSQLADEHSGIPAYTYGAHQGQEGGGTASGLSMLMNAASKSIKNVVSHIDQGLIVPTVRRVYEWVMQYHPDESIKGDVSIQARGAMSLVAKEQLNMRRLEFLQHVANDMDAQIIGPMERRALLEKIATDLDVPAEDIVPTREELQQRLQQQQEQQQVDQQPQGDPQQVARQREQALDGAPAGEMRG